MYFTIILHSALRAVLLVRVCSCSFVRPIQMCKDNPVTLSTLTPSNSRDLPHMTLVTKTMLRDLHHVMNIILRDLHHVIYPTQLMLRVLPHVHLRDLYHVICVTIVIPPT